MEGSKAPPIAASGRSLCDFEPLLHAEQKLLDACRAGKVCGLSNMVPTRKSQRTVVRAGFIRFLALGGDERAPVHEVGVRLKGAWIEGPIDIESAHCVRGLWLEKSRIEKLSAQNAKFPWIVLSGSRVGRKGAEFSIDLISADIAGNVFFDEGFHAVAPVQLIGATVGGQLNCVGGRIEGSLSETALCCDQAHVGGSIFLREGFHAKGTVRLPGVAVGGQIDCSGGRFESRPKRDALICDRAIIRGEIYLREGFHATGAVGLVGVAVDGMLDCSGGRFEGPPDGTALFCDQASIRGEILFREEFHATGTVRLPGATVGGTLDCTGARFEGPANGNSLSCDGAHIKGDIFLSKGFRATASVRLSGATVGGQLDCVDGYFGSGPYRTALDCTRADIKGDVFLNGHFHTTGQVRFFGATVGGQLNCDGGRFESSERGYALTCEEAVIKGAVLLSHGFHATGGVRFLGAAIGGTLDCIGGRFETRTIGTALNCDGAEIRGDALLTQRFRALGRVRMQGARIRGKLDCSNGRFEHREGAIDMRWSRIGGDAILGKEIFASGTLNLSGAIIEGDLEIGELTVEMPLPGPQVRNDPSALDLEGLVIAGSLRFLAPLKIAGRVDLSDARASRLDDKAASWTDVTEVDLDGFTYGRFSGNAATDARTRVEWLNRQPRQDLNEGFKPQPWEQCARVLRDSGHPNEAKAVLIAKEEARRRAGKIPRVALPFHWLYGKFVGYGHKPQRLVLLVGIVWLVCGGGYWVGANYRWHPYGTGYLIEPTSGAPSYACARRAEERAKLPDDVREVDYRSFAPFLYSLDHQVPVINFGHRSEWRVVVADKDCNPLWLGQFLRALTWLQVSFGWAAAIMLGAAVGTLVKRD
jgi:hypothetical protein